MRYSIPSCALVGAVTVSAMAVPATNNNHHHHLRKRIQYVDLSSFSGFPSMNPQQILDEADQTIKALFDEGKYNDGPWDKFFNSASGDEINTSSIDEGVFGIFDDVEEKIEDAFDGISGWKESPEPPSMANDAYAPEPTSQGEKEDDGDTVAVANNTNAAAATCSQDNADVRLEWTNFADADRTAFVGAIKCLMDKPSAGGSAYSGSRNRYEDLVAVHRDMTPNVHRTASFLPWHRYFVWTFEQLMQNECGYAGPFPWWDETKNAGDFGGSDMFSSQWFGELPERTADGQGACVATGPFANTTLHIGPGDADTDHCLSRGEDKSETSNCNSAYVNSCLSHSAYGDFSSCLELGPHAYGHNGIGAVMSDVASSVGDPVFFMHHFFVDHTFRLWQNADASRLSNISGCADVASPCTPISLDYVLSSAGLAPDMSVGDVLNTLGGSLCYRYDY